MCAKINRRGTHIMSFAEILEEIYPGKSLDDILINHSGSVSLACTKPEYLDELGAMIQGLRERGLMSSFLA